MLKQDKTKTNNGPIKVLNAPVHLGSIVDNTETDIQDIKSIWVVQRDDTLVRIFKYKIIDYIYYFNFYCYLES